MRVVIRSHQKSSEVIRGHQLVFNKSSEVISWSSISHQRSEARGSCTAVLSWSSQALEDDESATGQKLA